MEDKTQSLSTEIQSLDTIFALLRDQRRRAILRFLRQNGAVTIDSLSAQLAGNSENIATDDEYARIRIELHHTHLPRLDSVGLINYDSATGLVEPGDLSDERFDTLLNIGDETR